MARHTEYRTRHCPEPQTVVNRAPIPRPVVPGNRRPEVGGNRPAVVRVAAKPNLALRCRCLPMDSPAGTTAAAELVCCRRNRGSSTDSLARWTRGSRHLPQRISSALFVFAGVRCPAEATSARFPGPLLIQRIICPFSPSIWAVSFEQPQGLVRPECRLVVGSGVRLCLAALCVAATGCVRRVVDPGF